MKMGGEKIMIGTFQDFRKTFTPEYEKEVESKTLEALDWFANMQECDINDLTDGMKTSAITTTRMFFILEKYHDWLSAQIHVSTVHPKF